MKYDVFANILAMYPTTPTKKISERFGVSVKVINVLANSMGVYKKGRKHKRKNYSTLVIYDARTAEVGIRFKDSYIPQYSKKPVKLKVDWKEL